MKKQENQKPKKKSSLISPPSKKQKTRYVWLKISPDDLWLKVRQGDTIMEALQNVPIRSVKST